MPKYVSPPDTDDLLAKIKSALKHANTPTGGSMRNVDIEQGDFPAVSAEPSHRQRLDHYVGAGYDPGEDDDPEGWDEDGWQRDYAGPLTNEIEALLKKAGIDLKRVSVDIGEKGHVEVQVLKTKVEGTERLLAQEQRVRLVLALARLTEDKDIRALARNVLSALLGVSRGDYANLYLDTKTGKLQVMDVNGDQTYVVDSGPWDKASVKKLRKALDVLGIEAQIGLIS